MFLFKCLNKILKGYKMNNHEGGEIEMTFFREFHRVTHMHRVVHFCDDSHAHHSDSRFCCSSQKMYNILRTPRSIQLIA